jgi:histidyl-tRNA synthetase
MKKVLRLTERDLTNIIKRVIKEEESSKDLYTLLHSLRNSINDENKRESLSKLEDILSIVRDMEDKNVKHKSKRN